MMICQSKTLFTSYFQYTPNMQILSWHAYAQIMYFLHIPEEAAWLQRYTWVLVWVPSSWELISYFLLSLFFFIFFFFHFHFGIFTPALNTVLFATLRVCHPIVAQPLHFIIDLSIYTSFFILSGDIHLLLLRREASYVISFQC